MAKRQKIRVDATSIYNISGYDFGSIDDSIEMLKRAKERVLQECPEAENIRLDYDDHDPWDDTKFFKVFYDRLETLEEMRARIAKAKAEDEVRLERKRKQLEQLKRELGEV